LSKDWSIQYPHFARLAWPLQKAIIDLNMGTGSANMDGYNKIVTDNVELNKANAISSEIRQGNNVGEHLIVLDIDHDACLVPSSTPGHWHLIINKALPWNQYEKFLKGMAKFGVIEDGYAGASIQRQATWLRVPWERK
jgi:hypothetical protein